MLAVVTVAVHKGDAPTHFELSPYFFLPSLVL